MRSDCHNSLGSRGFETRVGVSTTPSYQVFNKDCYCFISTRFVQLLSTSAQTSSQQMKMRQSPAKDPLDPPKAPDHIQMFQWSECFSYIPHAFVTSRPHHHFPSAPGCCHSAAAWTTSPALWGLDTATWGAQEWPGLE